MVYDSERNCFHPEIIGENVIFTHDNSSSGIFSWGLYTYYYIFMTDLEGNFINKIRINDSRIYYMDSIDDNNFLISLDYREDDVFDYHISVGVYNLESNNITILLANANYSIEQISYSQYEEYIVLNCFNDTGRFLRKLPYDPTDNNLNGFADNIDIFEGDPTASVPVNTNKDGIFVNVTVVEETEKESLINIDLSAAIFIILSLVIILIVVAIIIKKRKERNQETPTQSLAVTTILTT